MVAVCLSVQHAILDEDRDGSQDEGHKQVHVDEVPGAVELPEAERGEKEKQRDGAGGQIYHFQLTFFHAN